MQETTCNTGDPGLIPRNGNPLQDSCLGNPMDRGAWQATAARVARVRHDSATKPPPKPMISGLTRQLKTTSNTKQLKLFIPANSNLFTLPCLDFPKETH